jgi:hypothetical protein
MKILKSLAAEIQQDERIIDSGIINITNLKIQFEPAKPRHLTDERLSKTYLSKPLVKVDNENLFGELAILRYLQKDGWNGVWVDTFHGRGKKLFWNNLPPEGKASLADEATFLYDKIVTSNAGKASGFFDVFAWKNGEYIFLEYKGAGDKPNQNETKWINSAIKSGIKPEQLYFITY